MGDPPRLGLDPARCLGTRWRGSRGSARNLEQDLRGEPQGATYGDQSPPGRDIPGGRELEKLVAFLIAAADKNRDR